MNLITRILPGRSRALIVSFPKSGRTWLRVMLDDLGIRARYAHDGADHQALRPIETIDPDKSRYGNKPVLLLVRDPRDTAVSGFFQVKKRHELAIDSLSDCIRSDLHGVEKIVRFNLDWFAAAGQFRKFAVVRYEDLHADTPAVLHGIAAFLNVTLDAKRVAETAAARTFDKMHAQEASGEFQDRYGKILAPKNPDDHDSFKVREGKIGGYRNSLSDSDIAYCDQVLTRCDYWNALDEISKRYGVTRNAQMRRA